MINKKGQGTIEYLVIIAIVVVIALVLATLIFDIIGDAGQISESQSIQSWRLAQPWAIDEWVMTSDGNLTMVIRNNSFERQEFNDVNIGNIQSEEGAGRVAPGGTINRTVPTGITYQSGSPFSILADEIIFDYNSGNISHRKQYGAANIVGTVQ